MSKIPVAITVVVVLFAGARASAQTCDVELTECREQVSQLTESRNQCVVDLLVALTDAQRNDAYRTLYADATRDLDEDGALDRADRCAHTDSSLAVDLGGCSLAQFCATQVIERQRDRQTCRRLDWRNDEPGAANPGDCRFEGTLCAAAVPEPPSDRGCQAVVVTVVTSFAGDAAGISTRVGYPGDVIEIPGFGDAAIARTTNVTGVSGLFVAADDDTASWVAASLLNLFEPIPAGPFVEFRFDCRDPEALPVLADFACTADVSSYEGDSLPATCSVELAFEP